MNAIDLLKHQHREVEALFDEIQRATGDDRYALLEEVADTLSIHSELEEQIFYPGVRSAETEGLLEDSVEEHLQMKRLLSDMLDVEPEDTAIFAGPMDQLMRDVRAHVQEEENQLFPIVVAQMDAERLERLGDRLQNLAESLADDEAYVGRVSHERERPAPF